MRALGQSVAALTLMVQSSALAQTDDLCRDVTAFLATDTASGLTLPGAESCGASLSDTGATAYHCQWSYPFRADAAQDAFKSTHAALEACFPGASVTQDQPVNHPDFYELQTFDIDEAELALSLKDKSALGRTYIFLHVRPAR